jgi:pyruvate/2-oxoglutarate dehydrogenase complex dihydrolipoamide dehydrogenase (E3) component
MNDQGGRHGYDILILGGGSAGIVSGIMAAGLGMRVLLIEKEKMGGECLHTGCVPSKALLHAAQVAQTIRTADRVGLVPRSLTRAETGGVLSHVRETIRAVETADATTSMLRDSGVEIRFGQGRFVGPHQFLLDGQLLTAAHVILATGSRPVEPNIPGLEPGDYLTNKTLFDLEDIPDRLLVVGGGPVSVEMAQAFARLGSQVMLVGKGDRLLAHDDVEMARQLETHLREDGIDIHLQTTLTEVRQSGDGRIAVLTNHAGESVEAPFDQVLFGIGRRLNTEGLGLEEVGVEYDQKAVKVDARLQTTVPHIYACGDLLGHDQFSHMAEYEAKIVVRNIVFPGQSSASFALAPWTTFTQPELTHIGATEEQLQTRGVRYEVYRQPFAQNDRAITDGETQGFIKVLTQGLNGKILGVHILGSRSGELAQEWILAMEQGLSIRAVADLIHIYPTLSMISQHVAQRWYERKAKEPWVAGLLQTYAHSIRPHQAALAGGALGLALAGLGFGLVRRQEAPQP